MNNYLRAEQLAKRYKSRQVVQNISLEIAKGEIVGLLGPNGAGKTTSFYMIVGLIKCDQGKVTIGNNNITHLPMHARARCGIGYLPQETSIFRNLTVEKNILAVLELRKELNNAQRLQILDNLLQELQINHLRARRAISLSGGEKRRVEIARVLAMEPQFILFDEPFAGVDPISVIDIKRIIIGLSNRRGLGVLITDHNVRETLEICQRAYIVNEGQIIAQGSPNAILTNQQVREVYLGDEFDL